MNAVIFCPVGSPLTYHMGYLPHSHWRKKNPRRKYSVVAYQYNDFELEADTYDEKVVMRGSKWQLAKHFLDYYDWNTYEYVAFFDDDLVTDRQNINRAINLACTNNLRLFQLSTIDGSDSSYPILWQNKSLSYSITNFVEGMGPFIHRSLIPVLLKLWEFHDFKSGWGLDLILSKVLGSTAAVIHEASMYHPARNSHYNKGEASGEARLVLEHIYPTFMHAVYGIKTGPYQDRPKIICSITNFHNSLPSWLTQKNVHSFS